MAYYCLHKFKKWPSEFLGLPNNERAFVVASIEVKLEEDKKQKKAINSKSRR